MQLGSDLGTKADSGGTAPDLNSDAKQIIDTFRNTLIPKDKEAELDDDQKEQAVTQLTQQITKYISRVSIEQEKSAYNQLISIIEQCGNKEAKIEAIFQHIEQHPLCYPKIDEEDKKIIREYLEIEKQSKQWIPRLKNTIDELINNSINIFKEKPNKVKKDYLGNANKNEQLKNSVKQLIPGGTTCDASNSDSDTTCSTNTNSENITFFSFNKEQHTRDIKKENNLFAKLEHMKLLLAPKEEESEGVIKKFTNTASVLGGVAVIFEAIDACIPKVAQAIKGGFFKTLEWFNEGILDFVILDEWLLANQEEETNKEAKETEDDSISTASTEADSEILDSGAEDDSISTASTAADSELDSSDTETDMTLLGEIGAD